MPMPSSTHWTTAQPSASRAVTVMCPPGSVYFAELLAAQFKDRARVLVRHRALP